MNHILLSFLVGCFLVFVAIFLLMLSTVGLEIARTLHVDILDGTMVATVFTGLATAAAAFFTGLAARSSAKAAVAADKAASTWREQSIYELTFQKKVVIRTNLFSLVNTVSGACNIMKPLNFSLNQAEMFAGHIEDGRDAPDFKVLAEKTMLSEYLLKSGYNRVYKDVPKSLEGIEGSVDIIVYETEYLLNARNLHRNYSDEKFSECQSLLKNYKRETQRLIRNIQAPFFDIENDKNPKWVFHAYYGLGEKGDFGYEYNMWISLHNKIVSLVTELIDEVAE